MKEFDSRDIARKVEAHFDYKVPIHNGQVLLHPIVLVVLDVLKAEGFIELEHRGGLIRDPEQFTVPSRSQVRRADG
jgi:hypothetical protein